MPMYAYWCEVCDKRETRMVHLRDRDLQVCGCEVWREGNCGSPLMTRLLSAPMINLDGHKAAP